MTRPATGPVARLGARLWRAAARRLGLPKRSAAAVAQSPNNKAQRAAFCRELDLDPALLERVQLWVSELRPIVAAIRKRPGGSLLVFGCGNDSPFWEAVNRGGMTAFVEDNPEWAAITRQRLRTAPIHTVRYGTLLPQWRTLLKRPEELGLELPPEVAAERWDVILVDGPAGHSADTPGRMKSIHAAATLVRPGGQVFVHDCNRAAEDAFASRYLGDKRLVVEVNGRAVLRGYAF